MIEGQSETIQPTVPTRKLEAVLYGDLEQALHTDQYEIALKATEDMQGLRSWRVAEQQSPAPQFYRLFEASTRLNAAFIPTEERAKLRLELADRLLPTASSMTPRVRDLYAGFVAELEGTEYSPDFEMTQRQLQVLKDSGDLSLLQEPSIPWGIKLNRMQTRIESELLGRKALDRRDKASQKVEERQLPQSNFPPPVSDESKPSMDEMERLKEGETASAIWTISPGYGGYYKEQSYDTWDTQRNTWRQSQYEFTENFTIHPDAKSKPEQPIIISATIPPGQTVRIPKPYTYEYSKVLDNSVTVLMDQNNDYALRSNNSSQAVEAQLQFSFLGDAGYNLTSRQDPKVQSMPATLSENTNQKLEEILKTRAGNIARARALAVYTMRHLQYSNDSSFNTTYENDPNGYIGAIDRYKQVDCDVANTYFAALCSKLNIPVRHVTGHMVKGKDNDGNSRITYGTGHAWTEVWDDQTKLWVRIDATPAGDPQMEEQGEQTQGVPGDYGGQEAVGPTNEQLEELAEKLQETAERLSYTQEERELAEQTGIEPREARKIVKEIQEAEETRLPNGEKVVDVMSQLWLLISQSRMTNQQDYTGPVRKREGGEEIEDIVAHKIGVISGESDPASRQKEAAQQINELILRALQLRIIGDKSGSMSQTVDGETKWRLQRKAMYLMLSSLDRAEQNIQRVKTKMKTPLGVYTQVISFRGSGEGEIDVDKPLSNTFSATDKVALWHSLGVQGGGNGDVPALSHLYDEIKSEHDKLIEENKVDDTLRIVIACSDGMPDNPADVRTMAQQLGQLNTIVVGVGLTETATQVPIIFDTPYSKGDLAKDLNDLPAVWAKHVVMEAIKLFPQNSLATYQRSIDNILSKFNSVGEK